MNRELTAFFQQKFAEFTSDLVDNWAVRERSISPVESDLRNIYRRFLGLACLGTVLSQVARRNDYIRVLPEVTYLSVVMSVKGLENPSSVLIRPTIELVLKHIFFATHPVEFSWSLTRPGYREITFQFLLEYLRKTEEAQLFPAMAGIIEEVELQFHELSRFVHMHSRTFMPYRNTKNVASASVPTIANYKHRCNRVWPVLTCLLIAHFPGKFLSSSAMEKAAIVAALGATRREQVKKYLHQLSL